MNKLIKLRMKKIKDEGTDCLKTKQTLICKNEK